jgi:hypothetical protein
MSTLPAALTPRHTPGPWKWDGRALVPVNPDPARNAVHTIVVDDGGSGFLGADRAATQAELDADLALIAAAPELLAALEALRNASCIALEGSAALAVADVAIAKARAAALPRYHVTAVRSDGRARYWYRQGGNSIDHALEAQQAAGLGGVVRVVPLDMQVAA